MNTKQNTNWWIDLFLFAVFITSFFLDLTGVAVHQWIGILSGTLVVYHLFLHLDWVEAVSKRFFIKASARVRIYYSLDALLLLWFAFIGVTGLVISTWLNLPLSDFTTWLNIHITFAIATLVVLFLKLALHWRWIAHGTRNIWARPVIARAQNAVVQPAKVSSNRMGRREFLQVMGIVGVTSFLALANASRGLAETVATTEATTTEDVDMQTVLNTVNVSTSSTSSSSDSNCTVRCRKGCSYPGHCHRYIDTNDNGRCDLGECS